MGTSRLDCVLLSFQRFARATVVRIPKRQNTRTRPIEYVVSGQWPNAELEPSVPAEYAQAFARNVLTTTAGQSLRQIAHSADLDPMTVRGLLRGDRFPDTVSVSKLEAAYRALLWPRDSERRRILREVLGEEPEIARVIESEQPLDSYLAMARLWENHFGYPLPSALDAPGIMAGVRGDYDDRETPTDVATTQSQ